MKLRIEFPNGDVFTVPTEVIARRIYSYISGISDKVKLYYIREVAHREEEVLLPLEKDTLKSAFPEYYQKWSDGFSLVFLKDHLFFFLFVLTLILILILILSLSDFLTASV